MKKKLGLSVLTAIFLFLFSAVFLPVSGVAAPGKADKENTLKPYGNLPLYFIENKGQIDPAVRFYVKTSDQTLFFTDEGIVFDLFRWEKATEKRMEGVEKGRQAAGAKKERLVFNLGFENAREGILIEGLDRQDAVINHLAGDDGRKWKTGIPTYKGVVYRGVYKGIDLRIFGNGKAIEYEFIVNPGGSPDDILLTYNGIEGLRANGKGELLIETAFGELKETKPYIYQEIEGERTVDGSFQIQSSADSSQNGKFSYGFQVASYNPSHPLIIDPTLSYSTYLGADGSNASNGGNAIAIDSSGNAYTTGYCGTSNFPTKNPYQGTLAGGGDAFVTKLNPSGSALVYSTYLGGSESDKGNGIAVDASGNAYITGYTRSFDFPTKNPYQETKAAEGQGTDIFVTKLSPSGSALYSTYLGAEDGFQQGHGIAVDDAGNAYITGYTTSDDFPIKNPYQATRAGSYDAFITKLNPSGSALVYSTFLGGDREDKGSGIALDSAGSAYITGGTYSGDFPMKNPYQDQESFTGYYYAFVTKLSASGDALSYSTYLGGRSYSSTWGNGIAVDAAGSAYVIGKTNSKDFPTQNPYQATKAGSWSNDAFITKLSPSGNALTYSTYLGGGEPDSGDAIAVDGLGNAYVTGSTGSYDFPMKNPYQESKGSDDDAFVTIFSPSGTTLTYSTYLGGNRFDSGNGIAVDGSGNVYVAGSAQSSNFPTTPNAFQESGSFDAFVAKFGDSKPMITTQCVTDAGATTATGNGNITNLGFPNPTQHGICWNTTGAPTIADSKTEEGAVTATGAFTSNMTGLSPNTTYYFRAYATNNGGTSYGELSFTTAPRSVLYINEGDDTCGGKSPCYTSIQAGIDAASSGSSIRIVRGTYEETIVLSTAKSLILEGGWNPEFKIQTPNSTTIKAPSAPQGSLTIQMLTVIP